MSTLKSKDYGVEIIFNGLTEGKKAEGNCSTRCDFWKQCSRASDFATSAGGDDNTQFTAFVAHAQVKNVKQSADCLK